MSRTTFAILSLALTALAVTAASAPGHADYMQRRSNLTKRACEQEAADYRVNCGQALDLTKAVPYVRFVLSKTDGSGAKETSLDIKNCQSDGKLGDDSAMLQWRLRRDVDSDYVQACQTFILSQADWANGEVPPFSLQVADSSTWWGVQPKGVPAGEGKLNIQRLDPLWQSYQSFHIHCETGWDGSVGSPYFGKKCLVKQFYGDDPQCLSFVGRGSTDESTFLNGDVVLKQCDRQDVSQVINVKSVASEFSGTSRNFQYKYAF